MVVERGDVWWAELKEPAGSEPGYRRPVLVIQADGYNRSRLRTTIVVALTSNVSRLGVPGNVLVPAHSAGLPRDSVALVTTLHTMDKDDLAERAGVLPTNVMREVERGIRLVMDL